MSFTTTLKRAFGFSTESDDEELDTSLPTYAAGDVAEEEKPAAVEAEKRIVNPFARVDLSALGQPSSETEAQPEPLPASESEVAQDLKNEPEADSETEADPTLPGDLFDAVISLFNSIQPEFVARCISTEAQRAFIYRSLDTSLKRRLEAMRGNADTSALAADERARMMEELVRLREDHRQVATLRERMEQSRLSAERQKRALTDRVIDLQNKVDELERTNEQLRLNAAVSASKSPRNEADEKIISEQRGEIERLTETIEQQKAKAQMSDAMINDLTAKAAEAREETERLRSDMSMVHEMTAEIEKVEQAMKRKDARIAELTAQLDSESARLKEAMVERESMRRTIESNLYNQAHTEQRLRKEIKRLEKKLGGKEADASADAETAAPKIKKRTRKISAIDDTLDNTDWFDSTPPPGEGKMEQPENPDFGYQAPQRKKHTDNDAQMLLW